MAKTGRFIAFGETLQDYVPANDGKGWTRLVGGAPLNVASEVARLGVPSYMITVLAKDAPSAEVLAAMKREGVHADYVSFDPTSVLCHTEVFVDKNTGERVFSFFRDKASFLSLDAALVNASSFMAGDVLHMGTVCLLSDRVIAAQKKAAEVARKAGLLITFDPNLRPSLFPTGAQERLARAFLPFADILKLGLEEVAPITGQTDIDAAIGKLFDDNDELKLILVTNGAKGMTAYRRMRKPVSVPSVKPRAIVDTVGCGDSSFGAFIASLMKGGVNEPDQLVGLSDQEIERAMTVGALAGSLLCARKGALPMPSIGEIVKFAAERGIDISI